MIQSPNIIFVSGSIGVGKNDLIKEDEVLYQ
jgi:hypothetical protein